MVEIRLAKNAGFCWGVKRAIDISLEAAHGKTEPTYTYGPLIHNPQLLKLLKNKKINTIDSIDGLNKSEIIIRTHGITPQKMEEIKAAGHKVINATCPLVARVQGMIKKFSKKGYSIVIVGDNGHAEVEGLKGYAKTPVYVISDKNGVEALPPIDKVFIAAQTTCNRENYSEVVSFIQSRYQTVEVGDTICEATYLRQDEVIDIVKDVDFMIVVGGKNSANTNRLAKISAEKGVETILVETEDELDIKRLAECRIIGVTAGASTPKWLLDRVITKLEALSETEKYLFPNVVEGMRFFVKSNLYLAFGAFALTYLNMKVMGADPKLELLALSFFAVLSTYLFHQLLNASNLFTSNPSKYRYHLKYKKAFWMMAFIAFFSGLFVASDLGTLQTLLYLTVVIFGISYGTEVFKRGIFPKVLRLADIAGSKEVFAAIGWAVITVIVPYITAGEGRALLIALGFTIGIVWVRSMLLGLRDIDEDRVAGKEALPSVSSGKAAQRTIYGIVATIAVVLLTNYYFGASHLFLPAMLAVSAYLLWFAYNRRENRWAHSTKFEFFLDGQYFIAAILAFVLSQV